MHAYTNREGAPGTTSQVLRIKREETSGELKVIFVGLRESEIPWIREMLIEAIRKVKKSKLYREQRQKEKALIDTFGNDEAEEDSSATLVRPRKRKAEPRSPKNRPSPAYTNIPPPHERVRSEYNGLPLYPSNNKRNAIGH